jgi:hypothetical protein
VFIQAPSERQGLMDGRVVTICRAGFVRSSASVDRAAQRKLAWSKLRKVAAEWKSEFQQTRQRC